MNTEDPAEPRLKFYGLNDYGTYFQVDRAAHIVEQYDQSGTYNVSDVLELHNAQLFAANGLVPDSYDADQRAKIEQSVPELRTVVAKFFQTLDESNIADRVIDVGYVHYSDLLELFARSKVYSRCTATTVLDVLDNLGVGLGEMLANQSLVRACDQELRDRIVSDAANAEHILRKHLEQDSRRNIYLPRSFTASDSYRIINAYLDSPDANPNFVQLVLRARVSGETGIDAKTKLKTQRTHERCLKEFFEQNQGTRTGCEVSIVDDQLEPVEMSLDGLVARISYSRDWLEDGLDYATILNNFLFVFEYVSGRMLLTLPSYRSNLGVFERIIGVTGREDYQIGATFRLREQISTLSIVAYDQFLRSHDTELAGVIQWFFSQYLKDEFSATNFTFAPPTKASTFLEKSRHLFAEMESIVRQFTLYVENGELDTGLLGITSDPVRYAALPSFLDGKYVYVADNDDMCSVMHLLFSDQSNLTYISEELRADDAASLLIDKQISYDDFADHQKPSIDYLIHQGVLENADGRLRLASSEQYLVLKSLDQFEAASYYHYSSAARASIDGMVDRGWLVRRSALLTTAEASYFNYYLNQIEFSNGPDLRNRYMHGSHVDSTDENEHFYTYITALKLLIALVIKINDDLWLRNGELDERLSQTFSD